MYNFGEISFINFIPLATKSVRLPFLKKPFVASPYLLNEACRKGELDISPISFFAFKGIEKNYKLLPNFCIASDGAVLSVKIFSKYELSELAGKKIYFTTDSESSVGAFVAICRAKFNFNPLNFSCKNINEADAVLLIGDKALAFNKSFEFVYDLGLLWKDCFEVPMVFSGIVIKREIYEKVASQMSEFYESNLCEFEKNRSEYCALAAKTLNSKNFTPQDADKYYSALIYKITDEAFLKSQDILHEKFA